MRPNGVKHIKSSLYHPASNGAAERLVQWVPGTIVKMLGPVTYLVKVYGKVYKRHVNQMITTEIEMRNV